MLDVEADVKGAIDALEELPVDIREKFQAAYQEVGELAVRLTKPKIPVKSGALKEDLRFRVSKTAANVRQGRARVPYAGPVHWGWGQPGPYAARRGQNWKDSKPGPRYLWDTAYPTGSSEDGPAQWFIDAMTEAVNEAIEKLNRKQRKAVGL